MQQKLGHSESEAYSYEYMKKKLEKHFGEIIYTQMDGKPTVVTMRTTAKAVLRDYYDAQKKETNTDEKKIKLVKAAAKLIKQDIKDIKLSNESYPNVNPQVERYFLGCGSCWKCRCTVLQRGKAQLHSNNLPEASEPSGPE
ncbi:hypothetical protein PBY51_016431 [Eleginops maclovinus]|uniref:Uncharacterized protein n=1 Tax=Eleginops maclovinus TaxID=56733 RepID=A0AAN7XQZ6_ELEMC|nr:hypothetical protein PBY51_016431 [Eleginops maclovinus]